MVIHSITIITGAYPPAICGVGDYTYNLFETETAKNNKWKLYYSSSWKYFSFMKKIRDINQHKSNVINLQYPTVTYKKSLVPHLLCIYFSCFTKKTFSVTMHEFSQLGIKPKLASFIFLLFSNKLIFTTDYELNSALKIFPFIKKKCNIVKIYSNITSNSKKKRIKSREFDLGYFGLIREKKGIEEFIKTVQDIRSKQKDIKILFIGKISPGSNDFANYVFKELKSSHVQVFENLEFAAVAEYLNNCKIGYLPFPDGVSERRGSALAVLENGVILITRKGKQTPKEIYDCCVFVDENDNVADRILNLLNKSESFYLNKQNANEHFLNTFYPKSWDSIADLYLHSLFSMKNGNKT
jgi:glycosyltransferase involved in cell wall biosynthesis